MGLTPKQLGERLEHGEQQELATELAVHKTYVNKVVLGTAAPKTKRGRATVRRIQVAIARRVGEPVDAVFPLLPEPADAAAEAPRHAAAS